jgi:thiol-disulfide isomerase/thioredoxin
MTAMSLLVLMLLAQAPAALPATPSGCVKAARDFVIAEQRALKQVTSDAVRRIEAEKVALAAKCAAQFTAATVPEAELAPLIALYGEAAQPALAKATLDRALISTALPPASRGEVLSQAVISGLREPKSPERNARLEAYVDELDRLSGETLDFKIAAHSRLNGYYRGDDIDDGIIKHSTWLIDTAKAFTPAQRTQYGATIVNAHINMAEALAGRGQNDRAVALLAAAKTGWSDARNADRMLDPVIARYALVGNAGAPISAPRWLNAPANTTMSMPGAVTLLEFTAHWCVPCKESYPGVKRLLAKYGPQGFRVVFVTELWGYFGSERPLAPDVEFERDRDYFAKEGLNVPIAVSDPRSALLRGADGSVAAAAPSNDTAYEVGGIPQIHIIDKQGRIRLIMVGYDDTNETALSALIEKLLKEK